MPKALPELRKWQIDEDISRRELAEKLGFSPAYVNAIFAGKSPLSYEFIGRFLASFGYDATTRALGPYYPEISRHVRA